MPRFASTLRTSPRCQTSSYMSNSLFCAGSRKPGGGGSGSEALRLPPEKSPQIHRVLARSPVSGFLGPAARQPGQPAEPHPQGDEGRLRRESAARHPRRARLLRERFFTTDRKGLLDFMLESAFAMLPHHAPTQNPARAARQWIPPSIPPERLASGSRRVSRQSGSPVDPAEYPPERLASGSRRVSRQSGS